MPSPPTVIIMTGVALAVVIVAAYWSASQGEDALPSSSAPLRLLLLRNGADERDGSVEHTLFAGEGIDTLRGVAHASFHTGADANLHTLQGQVVKDTGMLSDGMRLHVVPSNRLFVWPAGKLGSSRTPEDVNVAVGSPPIVMHTVSKSPRIFSVKNFLSQDEATRLVDFAQTRLQRSHVGIGKETFHNERTSKTAWDTSTPMSIAIQKRAFQLLRIPWHQPLADAIQIIRYEQDQMYVKHTDYFDGGYAQSDPSRAGGTNRFVTILCYLTDVQEGGSTVFPLAKNYNLTSMPGGKDGDGDDDAQACAMAADGTCTSRAAVTDDVAGDTKPFALAGKNQEMPHCAAEGRLRVPPKRGDALLFYSQGPDGTLDPSSVHGGCPVLKGEKWAANIWVWNAPRPTFDAAGTESGTMGDHSKLHVSFTNELDHAVDLYWVEHGGGHQLFKTIAKHAVFGVNTYVGHRWVVKSHGADDTIDTYDMKARTSFVHIKASKK